VTAFRTEVRGRTHEEYFDSLEEANDRFDDVVSDALLEGVMLYKATGYEWMPEGRSFWVVRWVNPWRPMERDDER